MTSEVDVISARWWESNWAPAFSTAAQSFLVGSLWKFPTAMWGFSLVYCMTESLDSFIIYEVGGSVPGEGRRILDASQRRGWKICKKLWMRRVAKVGAKNFRLDILAMFLKHSFSCFVSFLSTFNRFVQRGGFQARHEGECGTKHFRHVFRGAKYFRQSKTLDYLRKIKGHIQNLLCIY